LQEGGLCVTRTRRVAFLVAPVAATACIHRLVEALDTAIPDFGERLTAQS
jgi:hypothetical protein